MHGRPRWYENTIASFAAGPRPVVETGRTRDGRPKDGYGRDEWRRVLRVAVTRTVE